MAYPPGWSVIPQILVRRERWPGGYKAKGIPLVSPSQEVRSDQPVLRIERGGGGNEIILSGLHGRVVDITQRGGVIIESKAAVVQGVVGVGNQTVGLLTMWQGGAEQTFQQRTILVVPGPLNLAMLRRAMGSAVTGIIATSISVRDLESFLAADLTQLLDKGDIEHAQAHFPPMTLLFTEGLGNIAMPARVMNLLSQYQGSIALLSGTTSVRHHIFPELVISLPVQQVQEHWNPAQPSMTLMPGAQVRICSGEHEGAIGVVDSFFRRQQVFAAGTRAHAVRLRLEDGTLLVVPRMLIERVG